VPLSEHEQHLLEQMEQALYAEDPKFASQMQGSTVRDRLRRHITLGILAVVAGLVLVVLGVVNEAVWLGAIGFALMVGGAAYAVTPPRTPRPTLGAVGHDGTVRAHAPSKSTGTRSSRKGKSAKPRQSGGPAGFMQRMEQRWDKRRGDGFR
jgi:DUF3040 family protein